VVVYNTNPDVCNYFLVLQDEVGQVEERERVGLGPLPAFMAVAVAVAVAIAIAIAGSWRCCW
jgi:hypothetical protein